MAKFKFKKLSKKKSSKKKVKQSKQINFSDISKSFKSLDPKNIGNWPIVVKGFLAFALVTVICLLAFAFPVKNKMEEISSAEAQQDNLMKEFKEKEAKARSLEAYKQQIREMESTFAQLLDQLPKETRIPDLVEDINMRGVNSGVDFKDISVGNEITKELFIEQPIVIKTDGDYHEFGNFVSGIASLSRIITMHDFTISNTKEDSLNELPELKMVLNANTYRAKQITEEETVAETKKGDKKS